MTLLLTPAQRDIVENRLTAAELNLRLAANSYAIWRKASAASTAPTP